MKIIKKKQFEILFLIISLNALFVSALFTYQVIPGFKQFAPINPEVNNFPSDLDRRQFFSNVKSNNLLSKQKNNQDLLEKRELEPGCAEINLLKSTNDGIEIEFLLTDLIIENISSSAGDLYQKLNLVGGGYLADIGKPELPTKGIYLDIPEDVEIELNVKSTEFHEEEGYNIYPCQPSSLDYENEIKSLEKDIETYQIDSFYPNEITGIIDIGIIRSHHSILLIICPVRYNPVEQKIRLYTKILIEINYSPLNSDSMDSTSNVRSRSKYVSKVFESMFEDVFLNYQSPSDFEYVHHLSNGVGGDDFDGADYLIVTPDQFYESILPLAQNKELKGLTTAIVNLSTIGVSPSADNISDYIQNAYDTWDPVPTYVLLVGDTDFLPVHYKNQHPYYTSQLVASDLYYSTVDGSDYFPDLFVGRLPVQTNDELDIIVDKIVNYEENIDPADTWRNKVLLAAYEQSGRFFINTSEQIRQYLETEGFICDTVYTGGSYTGTTADIINCINEGTFLVNHRNHGDVDGWSNPRFDISDINSLTNGDMLPVMFSINCLSGCFDQMQDCFGEAILKAENKGVVGYIGSTRVSYSGYNDELDKGLITSIWPEFTSGYTNYVGNSDKLGPILNFGKIYMYDKYVLTGGSYYGWTPTPEVTLCEFEEFNLLGDPEFSLFPSRPINNPPYTPTNPFPPNGTVGIPTNTILSVDVSDPEGDSMNISFYDASDDSLINSTYGVLSGGTAEINWFGLNGNTNYQWYVIINDGKNITQSGTWSFTTENNAPDAPSNPTPIDGAIGVSVNPTLSVDISDPDNDTMSISFYDASDDSLINSMYGVISGGTASTGWFGLSEGKIYGWYVIVTDGSSSTTSSIWKFTILNNDPIWDQLITDQIIEYGNSLNYDINASDLSGIASYWVNDTTNFYIDGNGILINTSILTPGTYWLEIRAYDPYDNYCTKIFSIIVEEPEEPIDLGIPGFNIIILISSISVIFLILIKTKKKYLN